MSQAASHPTQPTDPQQDGCLAAIVRLAWLIAGNVLLLFLAMGIAQRGRYSPLDAVYWAAVLALISVRYVDVSRFKGLTKDGAPASLRDWRRYAALLGIVSTLGWALAHWAGRFFSA